MPKIFCFIFARGGSQRIPNKNLKKINNKSLLEITINLAKKVNKIDKIFVSSDSNKILNIARKNNTQIIKRPKFLCSSKSNEFESWKHAIQSLKKKKINFDYFLSLPATSPLRNKKDISQCISSLDERTDMVVGITEANRSPYFNMVEKNDDGFINILIKNDNGYTRRQETPTVFDMTTVAYVTRPEFIRNYKGIFEGKVKGVEIPAERALDIDTELDFEIAEFLIYKELKSNKDKVNVK